MRRALCALVAMVAASLALVTPASAAENTMSQHRAGRYYMHSVCPANRALHRLDKALPANKDGYWKTKDLTPRVFRKVKRAARHYSTASYEEARKLYNPPRRWPSYVVHPVNKLAKLSNRTSRVMSDLGHAPNPQKFTNIWVRRYQPTFHPVTRASTTIRAKLDLPAPGKGC
jgi:hypothetical protein